MNSTSLPPPLLILYVLKHFFPPPHYPAITRPLFTFTSPLSIALFHIPLSPFRPPFPILSFHPALLYSIVHLNPPSFPAFMISTYPLFVFLLSILSFHPFPFIPFLSSLSFHPFPFTPFLSSLSFHPFPFPSL